jgi:hypothetical protein
MTSDDTGRTTYHHCHLSQMRSLTVIARNSSFIYKGRAVDVKQIGRELGVRYVLEDYDGLSPSSAGAPFWDRCCCCRS